MKHTLSVAFLVLLLAMGCTPKTGFTPFTAYPDPTFQQEYHLPLPLDSGGATHGIRAIAVSPDEQVWIASEAGLFRFDSLSNRWVPPAGEKPGACFSLLFDGSTLWVGHWAGLSRLDHGTLTRINEIDRPVTVICRGQKGLYALTPGKAWQQQGDRFEPLLWELPHSPRSAVEAQDGTLYVATDVGLHGYRDGKRSGYTTTNEVITNALTSICADHTSALLFIGGLGGVSIRNNNQLLHRLTPANGLASSLVSSVALSPDRRLWVGTAHGVIRYDSLYEHPSLLFSRRWLLDDRVTAIAFGSGGDAYVATEQGVSVIARQPMTLASKEEYFYRFMLRNLVRDSLMIARFRLETPGDTTTIVPEDDDNDGQYNGMYLAMESFRYAVSQSPEAREKAYKAFSFLRFLQEVTQSEGFFARTVVRPDWTRVHDQNRVLTPEESAVKWVSEPRRKDVFVRWRLSADGQWLWKGDTSSDEMCGHMFGYHFYYTLAADSTVRSEITAHVKKIVDYLMAHHYDFIDPYDGKATKWGVWNPDKLNRSLDWEPEKALNSLEMLSFLKMAYGMTADERYQQAYQRLITDEHYLQNALEMFNHNPAYRTYIDPELFVLCFAPLMAYETDPQLRSTYRDILNRWFEKYRHDHCPLYNYFYTYLTGTQAENNASIEFLKDTPLDLVDWHIDHTRREDLRAVREVIPEEQMMNGYIPPSIRATIRWDRNPYQAVNGDPHQLREPVFWLLPYWMGRYVGAIGQ